MGEALKKLAGSFHIDGSVLFFGTLLALFYTALIHFVHHQDQTLVDFGQKMVERAWEALLLAARYNNNDKTGG